MFDLNTALAEWRLQMVANGIESPEVLDELESHLRDDVEEQMGAGLSAQEAFGAALQRMGQASALSREFEKVDTFRFARDEARHRHHDFIGTEHLLLGLLKSGSGPAVNLLRKLGVEPEALRSEIDKIITGFSVQKPDPELCYTPRVKRALMLAAREATAMKHTTVGTEHILLGLLLEGDGVAARALKSLGVQPDKARAEVLRAHC